MPSPDPTTAARRYTAFLSYRHADNKEEGRRWAEWLHQFIETYEVPADLVGKPNLRGEAIPSSLYPVFRDEEELPADADLSENIHRALENSGLLIVLCSPRACESKFVADEIRTFKQLGKSSRILALLLDGEPNSTTSAECLPEPLRFGRAAADGTIDWSQPCEPIAADVRPEGRAEQGYTSSAAYRHSLERSGVFARESRLLAAAYEERLQLARSKIIAGLLGVPLGQLRDRDAAHRLKKARRRQAIASAVAVLALLLTGFALWQRHVAEQKRQEVITLAGDQKRLLESASLAAMHQADRLLAEADAANPYTGEDDLLIRTRRQEALAHLARALRFNASNHVARERFAREAIFSRHYFYGVPETRFIIPHGQGEDFDAFDIHVEAAKGRVITASAKAVQVWDVAGQKILFQVPKEGRRLLRAAINTPGDRLLTATRFGSAQLWDAATGEPVASLRHEQPLVFAQFSGEGHHVLTVDDREVLRVWNTAAKLIASRKADVGVAAAISPDGTRIALVSKTSVQLWEPLSDRLPGDWNDGEHGFAELVDGERVQFTPKGKYLAIVRSRSVEIRDGTSGELIHKLASALSNESEIKNTALSADGRNLLAGFSDGSVGLWDLETGEERRVRSHRGEIMDAAFSPDGRHFASAAKDQTFAIGAFTSMGPMTTFTAQDVGVPAKIDFLQANRLLTVTARINPVEISCATWIVPPEQSALDPLVGLEYGALRHDLDSGLILLEMLENKQPTHRYRVYSTNRAAWVATMDLSAAPLPADDFERAFPATPMALHEGAGRMAMVNGARKAQLWNFSSAQPALTLPLEKVATLSFNHDGSLLVTITEEGIPQIWDTVSGALRQTFPSLLAGGENSSRSSFVSAFSREGTLLAAGTGSGSVKIWEVSSARERSAFSLGAPVNYLCFDPDGIHLLVCTNKENAVSQEVHYWNWESGKPVSKVEHCTFYDMFLGPQQPLVLTRLSDDAVAREPGRDRKTLEIWNLRTGQAVHHLHHRDAVSSAWFRPDGAQLVTGSGEDLKIWDTASGLPVGTIPVEFRSPEVRFSADGTRLIAIGDGQPSLDVPETNPGNPPAEPAPPPPPPRVMRVWDMSPIVALANSRTPAAAHLTLASALNHRRVTDDGDLRHLTPAEEQDLRRELEKLAATGTPEGNLARWLLGQIPRPTAQR